MDSVSYDMFAVMQNKSVSQGLLEITSIGLELTKTSGHYYFHILSKAQTQLSHRAVT